MPAENKTTPVALVTGGSKGIGRAICVELARAGCYIVINYLGDEQGAAQTLAMVENAGGRGEISRFDVRDRAGGRKGGRRYRRKAWRR